MTIKPKWDSKSAGEYERSLTLRDIKVEDDDDIQDYKKPWVGLTDDEIELLRDMIDWSVGWSYIEFARAAEAKLKEKNT